MSELLITTFRLLGQVERGNKMADEKSSTGPAHVPGTRKGEELGARHHEPGREDEDSTGADRPSGKSNARMSTGINPEAEDPIDPSSPNMPPA